MHKPVERPAESAGGADPETANAFLFQFSVRTVSHKKPLQKNQNI
jgi:hypothetical protein